MDGADCWSVDWTDRLIMTKLLVSGWTDCWSVDGQIALSVGEWMGQTAFIMTKLLVTGWGRLLSLGQMYPTFVCVFLCSALCIGLG